MKIAAVVILYHPPATVLANIKTYYDYVEKIFVFDNTEEALPLKDGFKEFSKIIFIQDFENQGIAKRLNEACEIALQEQYDWLLTMDQDTSFSADAASNYFDCFKKYQGKENVAMFGTMFSRHSNVIADCSVKETDKLITSGSLLNLSLFKKVGTFDEALFIDSVDYDYCFRAIIAGFSIIQFSNIHILHPIGNEVWRSSLKTLFLIKKKKEIHSPLRLYYMYRNLLYLERKYKDYDNKYFAQVKGYVFSRIKTCFLYGRHTMQIVKFLMIAKKDFRNNNFGKIKHATV